MRSALQNPDASGTPPHNPGKSPGRPYGYPFSIAFGALCLIIVLILFVCWIVVLVKSEKKLIGFFTSLICVIPGCSFGILIYIGTNSLGEWVKGLLQL